MKYYTPDEVKVMIEDLVTGKTSLSHPNDPPGYIPTLTDRLLSIFDTMSESCYAAGQREVQQGVIKSLDLRHLLGLYSKSETL